MGTRCEESPKIVPQSAPFETCFWRNVAETYGARLALIAIGLATTVVVARTLGPKGRGLYSIAFALSAIGVQFGNLGLHASNTYYVAKDRGLLPILIGNTLLISFGVGGIGGLLTWILFALRPSLAPVQGILLALAILWIPFGLAYMLLQNLLLGIHEIRTYNVIEVSSKLAALLLLGTAVFARKATPEFMFAATLLAVVSGFLWVLLDLLRSIKRRPVLSLATFRENIGVGLKAYVIAFFGFLLLRVDLLMVGYLAGPQQAGYYSISETMAENVLSLPVVIGAILFPKLSEMHDREERLNLTKKAAWLSGALLLPMMILISLFARPLVGLVFGKSFLPAVGSFIWLMPGSFFLGIEIVIVQYLNSLGFPPTIVYSWMLVTVLNIAVNLWTIPAFGITGAAVVSTVSYFLIFTIILTLIWKQSRPAILNQSAAVSA